MKIRGITFEDFVNYKKPSMFLVFPNCSFKCDKECGKPVCQNGALVRLPIHEIPVTLLVESYLRNNITKAIVLGGLEPFDSWDELQELIKSLREKTNDDIVIYTGYTEEELEDKIKILKKYKSIIIKFGRFIPDQESHYDEVLGIKLASNNQYGKVISE